VGQPAGVSAAGVCGAIGLQIEVLEHAFDAEDGILDVHAVTAGGPAERAGVRLGDRIEKWNRRMISNREEFHKALSQTTSGSVLRLGLMRSGIRKQALITVP
jgi:S1-C subfamily serine protease